MEGCHAITGERINSAPYLPDFNKNPPARRKSPVADLASFRWMIPFTEGNETALGVAAKTNRWFP